MMGQRFCRMVAGFVLVVALTGAGCQNESNKPKTTGAPAPLRQKYSVEIKDFAFSPEKLTVGLQSRVTWTNKDSAPHTISGGEFDSGLLGQNDTYSYEFLKAGTYTYHCTVHPYMEGVIVVK